MTIVGDLTPQDLTPQTETGDHIGELVDAEADMRIAVCIPARIEATTIASIIEEVARLRDRGLVDELVARPLLRHSFRCEHAAGARA